MCQFSRNPLVSVGSKFLKSHDSLRIKQDKKLSQQPFVPGFDTESGSQYRDQHSLWPWVKTEDRGSEFSLRGTFYTEETICFLAAFQII